MDDAIGTNTATATLLATAQTVVDLTARIRATPAHIDVDPLTLVCCNALKALAAMQAKTLPEWQAKATALETCTMWRGGEPSEIEGDCGLAASLIADLLREPIAA